VTDYTPTFDGATEDTNTNPGQAADMDQDFTDIETAIASKIDEVSGAEDNLIALDSDGNAKDSGIAASLLTGITSNINTQIGLIDHEDAAITNYRVGGSIQMLDWDAYGSTAPSISTTSLVSGTHYKYYPTGNDTGGTAWTDLDNLPSDCYALLLEWRGQFNGNASGTNSFGATLHVYPGDIADSTNDSYLRMNLFRRSDLNGRDFSGSSGMFWVPLHTTQAFKVAITRTNCTTSSDKLIVRGFAHD
jgi:hypothetical protein